MLAAQKRKEFMAERATGIGGSDIAAVFNLGYGCRLKLWREKRGEVPDHPKPATGPMELGNLLEPYFATKYAEITGRAVTECGLRRHPQHSELLVHIDRMIQAEDRADPGVLEIKSMGRGAYFSTKRKGLPVDYILQINHGMLVTGLHWGAFAVGCRDFGVSNPDDLLRWDVDRDESVCAEILAECQVFWAQVENGPAPDPLEPSDDRCQDCEYRKSCQGAALEKVVKSSEYEQDESLAGLVREYVERNSLFNEVKVLVEETKDEIKYRMGNRSMVMAAGAKLQYAAFTKKQYVVKEHEERPLRIFPAYKGQER